MEKCVQHCVSAGNTDTHLSEGEYIFVGDGEEPHESEDNGEESELKAEGNWRKCEAR